MITVKPGQLWRYRSDDGVTTSIDLIVSVDRVDSCVMSYCIYRDNPRQSGFELHGIAMYERDYDLDNNLSYFLIEDVP